MSEQSLLLNEAKSWLNPRVNSMSIQGDLSINGSIPLSNSYKNNVSGTFVFNQGGTTSNVSIIVARIGNTVFLSLPTVSATPTTPSQSLDFSTNLPSEYHPSVDTVYNAVNLTQSVGGGFKIVNLQISTAGAVNLRVLDGDGDYTNTETYVMTPQVISYYVN